MPEQQNFHEEFSLRILLVYNIQNTVHIKDECPIEINQLIQVTLRLYFQQAGGEGRDAKLGASCELDLYVLCCAILSYY
jgi:hypothetical protein